MSEITDDIINRIIAFYLGECSDKEKEELEAWLGGAEGRKEDFERVLRICQRLRLSLFDDKVTVMKAEIMKTCFRDKKQTSFRWKTRYRYAACVVVLLISIALFYYGYYETSEPVVKVSLLEAKHGERLAVLTLPTGDEMILKGRDEQVVKMSNGIVMKKDSVRCEYEEQGITHEEHVYSVITVPKGGEYNFTLADGTNVWLNSGSELKFPLHFDRHAREIFLKGEAFLEVKSDSTRPFVVKTEEADVRVWGTVFNVMNYDDEVCAEVALLDGKVDFKVHETDSVYSLFPGNVVRMDKESSTVTLTEEDVSVIGAWRTGYFYFENMPMEELVVKLERWYQVRFVFANEEVKRMRFTGAVKKYYELGYVLKIIEKTKDICFVDFGDQIKVYQKY